MRIFCLSFLIDEEIGTLKNTHHIEIKDTVNPAVSLVRKIPLAFKPELEKELKCMVDLDIIELIQKPTVVIVVVVVEKPNGKLRVCLHSRPLNKAIKREHMHLPTLPYGIHSANEVFQREVTSAIFGVQVAQLPKTTL